MTDAPTTLRRSTRRHRPRDGRMGVFVTDQELIEYLGVPDDLARQAIQYLDKNIELGFPRKQPFWGDRRYLPAVEKWLDARHQVKLDDPKRRAS
ncbi:MAG: hypothetical protein AB7R40_23725 [Nitrospiraceae bacterium]